MLHCLGLNNMGMSKREFLQCYQASREHAFRANVISGGWKATGIQPRDINKPLNSRLRRWENRSGEDPIEPPAPDPEAQFASVEIRTPRSSRQITEIADQLTADDVRFDGATRRVLFRKIQKSLDTLNSQVGQLEHEKAQLAANRERERGKKRKRVVPDPNRKYIMMRDVKAVKRDIARQGQQDPAATPPSSAPEPETIDSDDESVAWSSIEVKM